MIAKRNRCKVLACFLTALVLASCANQTTPLSANSPTRSGSTFNTYEYEAAKEEHRAAKTRKSFLYTSIENKKARKEAELQEEIDMLQKELDELNQRIAALEEKIKILKPEDNRAAESKSYRPTQNIGSRGGCYTITKNGNKNYKGC
jgi:peptidoglycan hydrolase CwlO-like protein